MEFARIVTDQIRAHCFAQFFDPPGFLHWSLNKNQA